MLFKKFKKSVENLELFVAGIEGGGEVSSERGEADDVGVEEDFDQVWNTLTTYHQYIYVTYM